MDEVVVEAEIGRTELPAAVPRDATPRAADVVRVGIGTGLATHGLSARADLAAERWSAEGRALGVRAFAGRDVELFGGHHDVIGVEPYVAWARPARVRVLGAVGAGVGTTHTFVQEFCLFDCSGEAPHWEPRRFGPTASLAGGLSSRRGGTLALARVEYAVDGAALWIGIQGGGARVRAEE